MNRFLGGLAILLACTAQAFASTSVSCDAADASLKFSLEGAFGRTIGSGPGNFGGEIEIKLKGITLTIFDPESDGTPRKASGKVSCIASD
jgi:hypothetical protein